jgi:hypothetical protein
MRLAPVTERRPGRVVGLSVARRGERRPAPLPEARA